METGASGLTRWRGSPWADADAAPEIREQRASGETMTTLKNRPNTALLVVDAQNVVVEGAHGRDAVVANGDSFEDSVLETVLLGLGVGRLVVVGAETDACVRSTLHGAFVRGYDATLVSDAHTAGDRTA
jgi:nicotinamidase-related amidase